MRHFWVCRAKQGFYVGPALDHYRCYKLVKLETKQRVISDLVEFRHAYLQIPAVLEDDKNHQWTAGNGRSITKCTPTNIKSSTGCD
jgi:hypothetical protein